MRTVKEVFTAGYIAGYKDAAGHAQARFAIASEEIPSVPWDRYIEDAYFATLDTQAQAQLSQEGA